MKKIIVFVLLGLSAMAFLPVGKAAPAATSKYSTVHINVVRESTGEPFPAEDEVWVYLYKADSVKGKHYDEVREADADGNVTFTKVPCQSMRVLIIYNDKYTEPYPGFIQLGQDAFEVTTVPGDMYINWVTNF